LIKYWGISKMNNMRKIANMVFDKLDEWIISSVKAENDAMNVLIDKIRLLVERERRFKLDIELDVFDIYTPCDFSNFIDHGPVIYGNRSLSEKCAFSLHKFKMIYDEIKQQETQKNFVRIATFVDIYIKKYLINSNSAGLPSSMRSLSFHNYNKFLKYFEIPSPIDENADNINNNLIIPHKNEFLNLKNISIILALIHCKILDQVTEASFMSNIEDLIINNTLLSREDYMNTEFWFEKDTFMNFKLEEEVNVTVNEKAMQMKELIFDIFKQDDVFII
jgi:hypothetical protein